MWLSGEAAFAENDENDPKPIISSETAPESSSQTARSFSETAEPISIPLDTTELDQQLAAPTSHIYLPLIAKPPFMSELEQAVLDIVNERRAEAGCGPVAGERFLQEAAFLHSKDMADNDYFSHTGLHGSRFWERAEQAGYQGFATAENIAAGYSTAEWVMQEWMESSGHRDNILNCNYTHLGVGYHYDRSAPYRHYWTQVFGRK